MTKNLFCSAALLFSAFQATADNSWVVDSEKDWQGQTLKSENLDFKKGFADPNQKESTFSSKIKTFNEKKSAKEIIFNQSPVWQNWNPISNIGPSNLQDAPVL